MWSITVWPRLKLELASAKEACEGKLNDGTHSCRRPRGPAAR